MNKVFELLLAGTVKSLDEIKAVGHRVVHGGEKLTHTCLVDDSIIEAINGVYPLDPLHVPAHVIGLNVAKKLLPNAPSVAVFDTSFHQTIPEYAYLYAVPYKLYKEDHIRRYGAHGTSHMYVANRMAKILGKDIKDLNIITCHIGSGSSITAVEGGKSVDTSMGLTPLEGLVMGTRCGDIDPAILTYLGRTKGMNADELDELINKKSGLLGLSEISNDCRVLEEGVEKGDAASIRAMNVFNYRIVKYIGAYAMVMGRVDAIVFTAGIGENSPYVAVRFANDWGFWASKSTMNETIATAKNAKFRPTHLKSTCGLSPRTKNSPLPKRRSISSIANRLIERAMACFRFGISLC